MLRVRIWQPKAKFCHLMRYMTLSRTQILCAQFQKQQKWLIIVLPHRAKRVNSVTCLQQSLSHRVSPAYFSYDLEVAVGTLLGVGRLPLFQGPWELNSKQAHYTVLPGTQGCPKCLLNTWSVTA